MKLRNKKTGEIKEVTVDGYPVSGNTKMWECSEMDTNEETGYKILGTYSSLAELNEEWEDYEEPKDRQWYWCVDYIVCGVDHLMYDQNDPDQDEFNKSIGNYFDTKEEAEKAVEKLKAWKRLKDKGFVFKGVNEVDGSIKTGLSKSVSISDSVEFYEDMALLFGGEE